MNTLSQSNSVFQRIEKKYHLSGEKYWSLIQALKPYMQMDEYGRHTICNIYYDTPHYDLIRHSIEKPPTRRNCVCAAMVFLARRTLSILKSRKNGSAPFTNAGPPCP